MLAPFSDVTLSGLDYCNVSAPTKTSALLPALLILPSLIIWSFVSWFSIHASYPPPPRAHLSVPSLTSLLLSLPHCRTPEPVYSTVNKLCDKAPSPRHYSPFECNKSLLHSTPLPSYHLSLFPDSDISRYFLLPCSPLVCQIFQNPTTPRVSLHATATVCTFHFTLMRCLSASTVYFLNQRVLLSFVFVSVIRAKTENWTL